VFAIAWKEYRQIRLVALLLVAVLLIIYFVVGFTPWSDVRPALVPIGVGIIVSLSAALAFAEEKPSGTDLFLSSLPLGHARRWLGKAAVNLLLTGGALILFVSLVFLLDRVSFEGLRGEGFFTVEGLCTSAALLFTLWSVAVFYSSAFERSVVAMLFAWATVGAGLYIAADRLDGGVITSTSAWNRVPERLVVLTLLVPLLAVLNGTFLLGSLLLERKMPRRLRFVEKVAGVLAALAVAAGLSLLVTSCAIARAIRYAQEHPDPHDARTIQQLGTVPTDRSLLALRHDTLYRCTPAPDWQKGKWRRYAVGPGRAVTEVGRGWAISGDGKTLAFMRAVPKSAAEIAREILRNVFLDRRWEFLPYRRRLGLLDLDTGELVFPDALKRRDLVVICASWQGDPPKLHCLVDKVRPGGHQRPGDFFYVRESRMFVFSQKGELLETRDVEEIDAFRDPEHRLARESPRAWPQYFPYPRMEGAWLSIARYSSGWTVLRRRQLTYSGAVLLYDITTGRTHQRIVEHPAEHIAFSPTLDWELAFVDSNFAGWGMIPSRPTHRFQCDELDIAATRSGAPDVPPPWLVLQGANQEPMDVFRFTEGLEGSKVRYQFLNEDSAFVAFVIEYASSGKPRFEHADLESPGVTVRGMGQRLFEWRRVRAIAINLETMERSEVLLPPGITRLLAGPGGKRLFFHNAGYSSSRRRSYSTDCIVLEVPTLKKLATYRWPEGWGPAFGTLGLWGTFLDADTHAATVSGHKADIFIWRVGHEQPVPVSIPDLPTESEG